MKGYTTKDCYLVKETRYIYIVILKTTKEKLYLLKRHCILEDGESDQRVIHIKTKVWNNLIKT